MPNAVLRRLLTVISINSYGHTDYIYIVVSNLATVDLGLDGLQYSTCKNDRPEKSIDDDNI